MLRYSFLKPLKVGNTVGCTVVCCCNNLNLFKVQLAAVAPCLCLRFLRHFTLLLLLLLWQLVFFHSFFLFFFFFVGFVLQKSSGLLCSIWRCVVVIVNMLPAPVLRLCLCRCCCLCCCHSIAAPIPDDVAWRLATRAHIANAIAIKFYFVASAFFN